MLVNENDICPQCGQKSELNPADQQPPVNIPREHCNFWYCRNCDSIFCLSVIFDAPIELITAAMERALPHIEAKFPGLKITRTD